MDIHTLFIRLHASSTNIVSSGTEACYICISQTSDGSWLNLFILWFLKRNISIFQQILERTDGARLSLSQKVISKATRREGNR